MGYSVIIDSFPVNSGSPRELYMTYNHCDIFKTYDVYPRHFNHMKVVDIIPMYERAISKMEESTGPVEFIKLDISYKYIDDSLYKDKLPVVVSILKNVVSILKNSPDDYIWLSD